MSAAATTATTDLDLIACQDVEGETKLLVYLVLLLLDQIAGGNDQTAFEIAAD